MWLFGGVLALAASFTVFSRWNLHSPAVPLPKLNQLRVGMTMRDVRELLGEPRRETVHDELPEWHFGHGLKCHVLVVRFDEDGLVRHFRHADGSEPEGSPRLGP